MHGSSSVPKEWVDRINNAGGKMKSTSGVPEDQYLPAAKLGVCKVNIDTDGRLVWCAIHREAFRDDPANFDLRPPGKVFMAAYADYIVHKNTDARLGRPVGRRAEDAEEVAALECGDLSPLLARFPALRIVFPKTSRNARGATEARNVSEGTGPSRAARVRLQFQLRWSSALRVGPIRIPLPPPLRIQVRPVPGPAGLDVAGSGLTV